MALCTLLLTTSGWAHDSFSYGGIYRSRDMGAIWVGAAAGLFLRSATSAAIDPVDPTHILLGGDTGLLRTRNGGRTWLAEATALVPGPITAMSFALDGRSALASGPAGTFRWANGQWSLVDAPGGAVPARSILPGFAPGELFLLGRTRLFRSSDGGASFVRLDDDQPSTARFTTFVTTAPPAEHLLAIVDHRVKVSTDRGRHWRDISPTAGAHDTIAVDATTPGRIWTAAADRLYRSDDQGQTWQPVGNPLPEAETPMRDILADPEGRTILVTSHRGLYRSADGGASWNGQIETLPAHQEAGKLVRRPGDPSLILAIFSMIPLEEVWRGAVESADLLARPDPLRLAGLAGGAVLILSVVGLVTRWRRSAGPGNNAAKEAS